LQRVLDAAAGLTRYEAEGAFALALTRHNAIRRLRRTAAAVRVHFAWWGVHKTLAAQQQEEVGESYGADARLLSAGKKIVDVRHPAFRRLTAIRGRIIGYWRGLTLPYVEPGVRLIRQADVGAFVHALEGFRDELLQAEAELDGVYEAIKADARRRLAALYDEADYPPRVRGLFGVEWDFPSVEPPSYLLRLDPELYRQEQERLKQRFEEAVRLAEQAFAAEFARLVSHLAGRLADGDDGRPRVFRDSAVANLAEFFERFRQLNVSSNPDLDGLVARARDLVRGVTPGDLRGSAGLRQQIGAALAEVQTRVEGMIVDRPRRHILRPAVPAAGGDHAGAD
jgi:hypothetical protein